jgi:hypothetical protein
VRSLVLQTLALATALATAQAQTTPERTRLHGVTFDHWRGVAGPALLRPTLRLTTYRGKGPGVDLALVVFPDGISIKPPAVTVGLQAGLAQPIVVGPAILLLKAGGAGLTSVGLLPDQHLFQFVPGVQAGMGLLVPVDRKSALRFEVTRHAYRTSFNPPGVWSFGVGFTGGVRRNR